MYYLSEIYRGIQKRMWTVTLLFCFLFGLPIFTFYCGRLLCYVYSMSFFDKKKKLWNLPSHLN